MANILLVTTGWDEADKEDADARLADLSDDFWKAMISKGSRILQHWNTPESAEKLLRDVLGDDTTGVSCSSDSQNAQHSNTIESAEGLYQEGMGEGVMRSSGSVSGTEELPVLGGTHPPR